MADDKSISDLVKVAQTQFKMNDFRQRLHIAGIMLGVLETLGLDELEHFVAMHYLDQNVSDFLGEVRGKLQRIAASLEAVQDSSDIVIFPEKPRPTLQGDSKSRCQKCNRPIYPTEPEYTFCPGCGVTLP